MLYRNYKGELIIINKHDYLNSEKFIEKILEIKNIKFDNKNISKNVSKEEYINRFLEKNAIKNINNQNKNSYR